MLQSLRHPRDSKNCSNYKKIMKLTSNWLLVKRSLTTKSSLQLPNTNSSLKTANTNKRFINCKTRFAPRVVIGKPCNSAFSKTYQGRGRPARGDIQLSPGIVNTRRGAAIYESQDQPFSFRKQVQFGDRLQMPDLKSDADSDDQQNSPPTTPRSSTPHCGAKPMNQTFDVSHIPNLTGGPQDTAALQLKFQQQQQLKHQKSFTGCKTQRSPSSKEDIRLMLN